MLADKENCTLYKMGGGVGGMLGGQHIYDICREWKFLNVYFI